MSYMRIIYDNDLSICEYKERIVKYMDNFIYYCDSMMIANEGVKEGFEKVKAWLIKMFSKILDMIQITLEISIFKFRRGKIEQTGKETLMVSSIDTGKLKTALLKLIARCKAGLSKSESLNAQNPELAKKLQNDVTGIQSEYVSILYEIEMPGEERKKLYSDLSKQTGMNFAAHGEKDIRMIFQKGNVYDAETHSYVGHV